MMQPQSTLFRGPNEHVGPLKKDQCALTPKTCPLRKALHRGEVEQARLQCVLRGAAKVNRSPPSPPPSLHPTADRKSTRLNSSHVAISYAVFCLKKKKQTHPLTIILKKKIKIKKTIN